MRKSIPAVCLFLFTGPALALDPPQPPIQNPLASSGDYQFYHPDYGHRMDGLRAYGDGNYGYALRDFRTAARFADKPADAMIASMYWEGRGVRQDRATAYAWMDLAAERGYPWLLADRERYWDALSDDERKRAIEVGAALYAEYGDDVALPRLHVWMRRGLVQATGSHTGFVGTLTVRKPGVTGLFDGPSWDANDYYAATYWQEKPYLRWQNSVWHPEGVKGTVDVGPLQRVGNTATQAPASAATDASGTQAQKPDQH